MIGYALALFAEGKGMNAAFTANIATVVCGLPAACPASTDGNREGRKWLTHWAIFQRLVLRRCGKAYALLLCGR